MDSTPEHQVFEKLIEFFQSGKDNWQKEEIVKAINIFKQELGWIGIQESSWKQVVKCWNACPRLPRVMVVNATRQKIIAARLRDKFFKEHFQEAILRIVESPFLMGQNDRGWAASFDWFIQPESVVKIMEGRYVDRTATVAFNVPMPAKKPPTPYELDQSIKLVESEIERLKSKRIYQKDTGLWMPDPSVAEELKGLFGKRRELINKRIASV